MNILMTGATGLVGTGLAKEFTGEGHTVIRLTRPGSKKQDGNVPRVVDVPWEPRAAASGENAALLSIGERQAAEIDAVINLAGASIGGGRWTAERKAELRSSRIDTTRSLVSALAKMKKRPRVLISASAIGYYGNRGDEVLTENSEAGRGFLAEVAKEWESEAERRKHLEFA